MSPIIEIDNILVSSDIFNTKFACDYPICKGVCCIIGESGAPLKKEECHILEEELDNIKDYLNDKGIHAIKEQGPFIIDPDGDLVTPLVKQGEECAYAQFDILNNCRCGIEVANSNGATHFRKPISCWLYPIRVSYLSNGMTALNMHKWHICFDAFKRGERENIWVIDFLKEPLVFAFGQKFFDQLKIAQRELVSL